MAFRAPTHAPQRQHQPYPTTARATPVASSLQNQEEDDSKEWVLFSPSQADFTPTTSTERTPRTAAGLSRLSDFGSLDTAARSLGTDDEGDEPEDDGTELDSLDDGLPAFREPASSRPQRQGDPAILPVHDGLGTFQASSQHVQDQLWQHEVNNPRRRQEGRHRRRSSIQRRLDTVDEPGSGHLDHDRWQRIETWRMEQSRALLHEIEKETRRRRRNSKASSRSERSFVKQDNPDVAEAHKSKVGGAHAGSPSPDTQDESEEETFFTRITRKVIRELMGIDDSLLSVIFGESLPSENDEVHGNGSDTRADPDEDEKMLDANETIQENDSWQSKLLERIARELGMLVHQLCEHPGAFSTYIRSSTNFSNDYAGIPVSHPRSSPRSPQPSRSSSISRSAQSPHFLPTLHDASASTHEALWGIEEEEHYPLNSSSPLPPGTTPNTAGATQNNTPESTRLRQEREYWERELDINMVFQYLRNRLGNERANPSVTSSARGHHSHTANTDSGQDLSHRAAIIRQNHPLVAGAHARSQTQFQHQLQLRTNSSGNEPSSTSPIQHRHRPIRRTSSSCASQSSKVSASTTRTLGIGESGSSRNYWDIGGSVGSGRHGGAALVAAGGGSLAGGVGSWGEV